MFSDDLTPGGYHTPNSEPHVATFVQRIRHLVTRT